MTDTVTTPVELSKEDINVIARQLLQCPDALLDKVSDDIGYKFINALKILNAKEKELA